jgi:hypothetical protein
MVRACMPCRSPSSHRHAVPVLLSLHQRRCSHRPSRNDLRREGSFPLMASVFSNPTLLGIQYVGFYLAFTLPTIVFLLCPIILFFGRNRYTRSPPTGSVLASCLRLLRYASRGRWSLNPLRTIHNFNDPLFWERVKPSRLNIQNRPEWMNFDDQWVDEVKRGFKACAVSLWAPIFCACLQFQRASPTFTSGVR